jgi:hypothetical protein
MGIENHKNTSESAFEKRFALNQNILKLRKDLETVQNGSYAGKDELAASILADIAESERALLELDKAPLENIPAGPVTAMPTIRKEGTEGLKRMGTGDFIFDDIQAGGSER